MQLNWLGKMYATLLFLTVIFMAGMAVYAEDVLELTKKEREAACVEEEEHDTPAPDAGIFTAFFKPSTAHCIKNHDWQIIQMFIDIPDNVTSCDGSKPDEKERFTRTMRYIDSETYELYYKGCPPWEESVAGIVYGCEWRAGELYNKEISRADVLEKLNEWRDNIRRARMIKKANEDGTCKERLPGTCDQNVVALCAIVQILKRIQVKSIDPPIIECVYSPFDEVVEVTL